MKSFLLLGLLLLAAPAWASCGGELVFAAEATIDSHLVGRLASVGLSRENLVAMIESSEAEFEEEIEASGVVGHVRARSPRDGVVYRTLAVFDQIDEAPRRLLRVIDFRRNDQVLPETPVVVPDYMAHLGLGAPPAQPAWLSQVMDVVHAHLRQDATRARVADQDTFHVRGGALAGKTFLIDADTLTQKLVTTHMQVGDFAALLERDEVGGLELTPVLAYDLGWPFEKGYQVIVGKLGLYTMVIACQEIAPDTFVIEAIRPRDSSVAKFYVKN